MKKRKRYMKKIKLLNNMKNIFLPFVLILVIVANDIKAQEQTSVIRRDNLDRVSISEGISLHFRSPEEIVFVDISTNAILGDLPVPNVLRIKFNPDSIQSLKPFKEAGIITVVGESFMAQYSIYFNPDKENDYLTTQIEILPEHMTPLEFPQISMTRRELRNKCMDIQHMHPKMKNVVSKGVGLTCRLNNIYAFGDYIFIDITYKNKTNIKYDIDDITFHIEDKKIYKATNVQSIQVNPIYKLYNPKYFKRSYRNIYVFKKFTFPNNKIFKIRITEEQISGRKLDLLVEYRDLLNADTF